MISGLEVWDWYSEVIVGEIRGKCVYLRWELINYSESIGVRVGLRFVIYKLGRFFSFFLEY